MDSRRQGTDGSYASPSAFAKLMEMLTSVIIPVSYPASDPVNVTYCVIELPSCRPPPPAPTYPVDTEIIPPVAISPPICSTKTEEAATTRNTEQKFQTRFMVIPFRQCCLNVANSCRTSLAMANRHRQTNRHQIVTNGIADKGKHLHLSCQSFQRLSGKRIWRISESREGMKIALAAQLGHAE